MKSKGHVVPISKQPKAPYELHHEQEREKAAIEAPVLRSADKYGDNNIGLVAVNKEHDASLGDLIHCALAPHHSGEPLARGVLEALADELDSLAQVFKKDIEEISIDAMRMTLQGMSERARCAAELDRRFSRAAKATA
jgi:hypothetical protein